MGDLAEDKVSAGAMQQGRPPISAAFWSSFLILCLLMPCSLMAQVVIEEGDTAAADTGGLAEYWDKHASLLFGASSARGLGVVNYRNYTFINFAWQHDFDWIILTFEADAYSRDYRYGLKKDESRGRSFRSREENLLNIIEVKNSVGDDTTREEADLQEAQRQLAEWESLPDHVRFSRSEAQVRYREANVKLNFYDYVQLSLGYHTVVWGQIEIFSPVDYVLPLRFASGNLSFSKANNRIAQPAMVLSIFPLPNIELQGYYFPDLILDPTLEFFYTGIEPRECNLAELEAEGRSERECDEIEERFEHPSKAELPQYAGRVLFYFSWATLGFLYHEGWQQFGLNDRQILTFREDDATATLNRHTGLCNVVPADDDEIFNSGCGFYQVHKSPTLLRVQNYGFESFFPMGQWSLTIDILYRDIQQNVTMRDTYAHNSIINGTSFDDTPGPTGTAFTEETHRARQDLYNVIIEEKDGHADYITREVAFASAVSRDSDTWLLSFGFVVFRTEARSGLDRRIAKLEEAALSDSEEDFGEDIPIPFFNVSRYLSEDKKHLWGLTGGFLGIGIGLVLYWGNEFFESMNVGLALEFLALFSSSEADVFREYQPENDAYAALRWVISNKF